jgi:hypothetical protein
VHIQLFSERIDSSVEATRSAVAALYARGSGASARRSLTADAPFHFAACSLVLVPTGQFSATRPRGPFFGARTRGLGGTRDRAAAAVAEVAYDSNAGVA